MIQKLGLVVQNYGNLAQRLAHNLHVRAYGRSVSLIHLQTAPISNRSPEA